MTNDYIDQSTTGSKIITKIYERYYLRIPIIVSFHTLQDSLLTNNFCHYRVYGIQPSDIALHLNYAYSSYAIGPIGNSFSNFITDFSILNSNNHRSIV